MAPTVPLNKAPGAPKPPGAPPVAGAKVEAGASTVPLSKAPGAPPKAPGGAPASKAGPTQALPKATVQLAKGTQPMAKGAGVATPPSAPVKRTAQDDSLYEEKDPEAGLAPLAIVCMVLAALLGLANIVGSGRYMYTQLGEQSNFTVPIRNPAPWEREKDEQPDSYRSEFSTEIKRIKAIYE